MNPVVSARGAAVFLVALVLNLAGLWSLPLTDRDEGYYAQVSREMRERGDLLLPHFNGKQWLEKPPLLYWSQAAAFAIFGENEFAVRLPSALAGAGTAVVVFGFALSLFRCPRVAFRSGLICATTPAILIASKLGMTDMLVVFFTTISAWAGWELFASGHRKGASRAWWWIFYAGIGFGILAKGPVGLLPLLAMGVFVLWSRPPRAIATLKPFSGLLISAGIAACWFVPATVASQGALVTEFFGVHVINRVLSPSNGHGFRGLLGYVVSMPMYLLLALPTFFPWWLWLPKTASMLWRAADPSGRYLFSGIFLPFGIFSLASTKLPFYTLPAFPLLACVVGAGISARTFRISAIAIGCLSLVFSLLALPFLSGFLPARALVASQEIPPGARLAVTETIEPSFIWYLRQHSRTRVERISESDILPFLAQKQDQNQEAIVVLVHKPSTHLPEGYQTTSVSGLNLAKGRWEKYSLVSSSPKKTGE